MKNILLFIFLVTFTFSMKAQQVDDNVFVQAGYTNQSYYSMANGEVANVNNNDWDIALDANAFGVSIRINGQMGTQLYIYEDGDTSDWSSIDTTGLSDWTQLYDSEANWADGAFNQNYDPSNLFDYGWGIYNTFTHQVIGDSLYVIKLSDGSAKKIWIESMISNVFTVRYADLDGSNDTSFELNKSDYSTKNYAYYSIQTGEIIDREPAADTWDIVFTKYYAWQPQGEYYAVTGVLHNNGVKTAQADDVNVDEAIWSAFPMRDTISAIGFDWKAFDMGTFSYLITEDQCFFVSDLDSNVWKIVFTEFVGTSTGEIAFTIEQMSAVGVEEIEAVSNLNIYPNPSTNGLVNLKFNNPAGQVFATVTDLSGKRILSEAYSLQGEQIQQLNVADLAPGMYIISIENETSKISEKLLIK